MRTTMNLRDDIYLQLKHFALTTGKPMGDVASELLEKALNAVPQIKKKQSKKFTLPVLPVFTPKEGARVITNEFINQLREEEGI